MFYEDTYAFLWSVESQFVRETELFFRYPLSRSLPTSLAIASPFYGILSTESGARVYNPFSFVSALFEGHGNTENPRAKGIEAWASVSIWLCLGSEANNGGSMSLCRRRPNAIVELSPCLWWPCKYLFTSSCWEQIILLDDVLYLSVEFSLYIWTAISCLMFEQIITL